MSEDSLAALHLSDPSRIAALKAIPRRQLAAIDMPLLVAVHLRAEDLPPSSTPRSSTAAPFQSIAELLAVSCAMFAAAAAARSGAGKDAEQLAAASDVTDSSAGRRLPCAAHASLSDPRKYRSTSTFDQDALFLTAPADRRRVRAIVKLDPAASVSDDDPAAARKLAQLWTANVARKHFLRNSSNSVASFVELWVVVPWDTVVQRLVALHDDGDKKKAAAMASATQRDDLVSFVLASRPALRQRVLSHLIGEAASQCETATSMLVFSVKLVPHVLSAAPSTAAAETVLEIPEVISSLGILTEWLAARRWIDGCTVELDAEPPFWLYANNAAVAAAQRRQQQQPTRTPALSAMSSVAPQRRSRAPVGSDDGTGISGGSNNNSMLAPPPTTTTLSHECAGASFQQQLATKATTTTCLQCRHDLLERLSSDFCPFGVAWVVLPTLLFYGLGAAWIDRSQELAVLAQGHADDDEERRRGPFATALATCHLALQRLRFAASEIPPHTSLKQRADGEETCDCAHAVVRFIARPAAAQQDPFRTFSVHRCPQRGCAWLLRCESAAAAAVNESSLLLVAEPHEFVVEVCTPASDVPSVVICAGAHQLTIVEICA